MRTIKFRGKDINGKWHYGDLLNMTEKDEETGELIKGCAIVYLGVNETLEDIKEGVAVEIYEKEIAIVDPSTVGQFTGLKDKNGVEIYEGDIVSFTYRYLNSTDACNLFDVEPQLNWDIKEDYLSEKNEIVHIKDGLLMFGNYDCMYHNRLKDEYLDMFILQESFGGTTFDEYFDVATDWSDDFGEINRSEPYDSPLLKEAERIIIEKLKVKVIGNIYDK